uniref:Tudor domain-containing protein n=1 Tax=Glycine max TaxID=3847 RepID=I1KNR5_SOYBN
MQGQGVDEVNIEELASNLSLYKDQLNQVRQLLNDDPSNSEYADMERELSEVIALTEELLATAKQNEIPAPPNAAAASPTLSIHNDNQVLDSSSDHQEKLPVGTKVQAVWSEDGEWYDATVEAYTPNGYYVSYDNWGNKEEVDPANIRSIQEGSVDALLEAERVAEATKQAIKRKIVQAASIDLQSRSLPAKLRIEADDPEDVLRNARKYMPLSQRCGWSNLKSHKISGKMLGSNFSQPKERQRRLVSSLEENGRVFLNLLMILRERLV